VIEFHCQHCGNHMRVARKYAGRDGCCSKCKRFIVIPQGDHRDEDVHAIPLEERCERVEALLVHMTERVRHYKKFLEPYRNEKGRLVPPDADAQALRRQARQEETQQWTRTVQEQALEIENLRAAVWEEARKRQTVQEALYGQTKMAERRTRHLSEISHELFQGCQSVDALCDAVTDAQSAREKAATSNETLRQQLSKEEEIRTELRAQVVQSDRKLQNLEESYNETSEKERGLRQSAESELERLRGGIADLTKTIKESDAILNTWAAREGEEALQQALQGCQKRMETLDTGSLAGEVTYFRDAFSKLLDGLAVMAGDVENNRIERSQDALEGQDTEITIVPDLILNTQRRGDSMAQAYLRFLESNPKKRARNPWND
jgi:chromosome segregation ATPase